MCEGFIQAQLKAQDGTKPKQSLLPNDYTKLHQATEE
jgi:hypothetical protein